MAGLQLRAGHVVLHVPERFFGAFAGHTVMKDTVVAVALRN